MCMYVTLVATSSKKIVVFSFLREIHSPGKPYLSIPLTSPFSSTFGWRPDVLSSAFGWRPDVLSSAFGWRPDVFHLPSTGARILSGTSFLFSLPKWVPVHLVSLFLGTSSK